MRKRIAIGVEYAGTDFKGWQIQKDARSVQSCLEAALSRVADMPISVVGAGRTDTGVHAVAQVAHFDTDAHRSQRSWVLGTNSYLPGDVSLSWAREVADTFHARFSATARTYHYLILNRPTRSPLRRFRACWIHQPLNAVSMQKAARHFLGEQDFSAIRAAQCQAKSPVRHVTHVDVQQLGELIRLEVTANAFLHHMVRNMAGILIRIGQGEADTHWAREVLVNRDRRQAGITAPPEGLYLVAVHYPENFLLPVAEPGAWLAACGHAVL